MRRSEEKGALGGGVFRLMFMFRFRLKFMLRFRFMFRFKLRLMLILMRRGAGKVRLTGGAGDGGVSAYRKSREKKGGRR